MSTSNKTIVIKKIAVVEGGYAAMEMNKFIPGTGNNIKENKSIPIEYEIEGILLIPIEVGKPVNVLLTKRNGVVAEGFFQTSAVTELADNTFKTRNSVYTYHYL